MSDSDTETTTVAVDLAAPIKMNGNTVPAGTKGVRLPIERARALYRIGRIARDPDAPAAPPDPEGPSPVNRALEGGRRLSSGLVPPES